LEAGKSTVVAVPVKGREFANWDGEWKYEAGEFTLHVGSAVDNIHQTASVTIS
jgi:beta-glucosidase